MSEIPVSRSSEITLAFVITEHALTKLNQAFSQFDQPVIYEIACSDGLTRQLQIDQLKGYENPPSEAIQELTIRTGSFSKTARIKFTGNDFIQNIYVAIDGPESEVRELSKTVDNTLAGARPWYSPLAKIHGPVLFLGAYITLTIISLMTLLLTALINPAMFESRHPARGAAPVLAVCTVFFALAALGGLLWLLARLRRKVFPMATFAIGQGTKRHHDLEKFRWGVVIAFAVGVPASLVAGIVLLVF